MTAFSHTLQVNTEGNQGRLFQIQGTGFSVIILFNSSTLVYNRWVPAVGGRGLRPGTPSPGQSWGCKRRTMSVPWCFLGSCSPLHVASTCSEQGQKEWGQWEVAVLNSRRPTFHMVGVLSWGWTLAAFEQFSELLFWTCIELLESNCDFHIWIKSVNVSLSTRICWVWIPKADEWVTHPPWRAPWEGLINLHSCTLSRRCRVSWICHGADKMLRVVAPHHSQ
jgi:hypothetical protein